MATHVMRTSLAIVGADSAADLGRLRQQDGVITARRALIRAMKSLVSYHARTCINSWLLLLSLRLTMMATEAPKPRASFFRLMVMPPSQVPLGFWTALDAACLPSPITLEDVAVWPYSVSILLEFSFLFWPRCIGLRTLLTWANLLFLFFELLVMFEQHSDHRLKGGKAIRPHLRPCRPLVHSSFPVSIGREIRHGCQILHDMVRSLGHLARFSPMRAQCSLHQALACRVGTVWTWPFFSSA